MYFGFSCLQSVLFFEGMNCVHIFYHSLTWYFIYLLSYDCNKSASDIFPLIENESPDIKVGYKER